MAKKRKFNRRNEERPNGRMDSYKGSKVDGKDMKCEPATNNDASWYHASQKLLNDAGRFSFNNPAGINVPITPADTDVVTWQENVTGHYIPGIATIPMFTGPGVSTDNHSAVNIAAKNLYSYVRFQNSGHANFDPADLMLYFLSMDSAYQWYATLLRLYGTIQYYNARNRYYAEALVTAQGFDYADLIKHLPDLRYTINRYVRQIGTLCVPGNLSIIKRHAWLFSNVYLDHDDPKAQIYMYTPAGLHFYNELDGAGRLDFVPWRSLSTNCNDNGTINKTYLDYEDIVGVCNTMTKYLMTSEDIGIMSGDVLKAYGAEKLYTLSMIDSDFTVIPSYNQEVLTQIRNATLNNFRAEDIVASYMGISQDTTTGALVWDPQIMSSQYDPASSKDQAHQIFDTNGKTIIDLPMSNPSPDDVMIATRLTCMPQAIKSNGNITFICGTEVACSARVWTFTRLSDGEVIVGWVDVPRICNTTETLCEISTFDKHPFVYAITYKGDSGWSYKMLGDLENYSVISDIELQKLHEVAILSEWDVPEIGVYQA